MLTDKTTQKNELNVHSPFSGDLIGSVKMAVQEDVEKAISLLKSYDFRLKDAERSQILIKTAQQVKEQKEELAQLITSEIGISLKDALHELDRTDHVLRLSAQEISNIKEDVYADEINFGLCKHKSIVVREPVGIICCITPFNHPLNQVVHKIAPAIAANNAILLKPSEKCPLTAFKIAEILYQNGLPKEMLQVIVGDMKEIGTDLIKRNDINMISFTGGTQTGELIANSCGIKKVSMELGGNDAFVVMPDADITKAAAIAVKGAFGNSGQRCSSIKRVFLFPEIADEFIRKFVANTKKLIIGDPMDLNTDIGTVINEESAKCIERRINAAIEDGAKLLIGGKREGALVWPTILDYVQKTSEIVFNETFGPVAPIIRVETFEEVVAMVNDTPFGLNAAIMTNDLIKAREFARRVNVGGVRINQAPGFRNEYIPFGGNKMSGFGRSGIKCAIEEMTNLKTIIINEE